MSVKSDMILNVVRGFERHINIFCLNETEETLIKHASRRYEALKRSGHTFDNARGIALGEVIDEIIALPEKVVKTVG